MPEQALTTRQAGELVTTSPRPADQNPAAVYVAHLAEGGRPTMRQALNVIAGMLTSGRCDASTLEWGALRYQHTAAIRAALAGQYAPATVNKMLSALRGTLKAAWRLGQMDATAYQQAADLEPVKGSTLPRGRALSAGELRALFDTCAAPETRRFSPYCTQAYGDLRPWPWTWPTMTPRPEPSRCAPARATRTERPTQTTAAARPWRPLLYPIRKGGRLQRRRMSGDAVLEILSRRAERACVAACSPHDLRRTWIGDLLDAGADIATVQARPPSGAPATCYTCPTRGGRGCGRQSKYAELMCEGVLDIRYTSVVHSVYTRVP